MNEIEKKLEEILGTFDGFVEMSLRAKDPKIAQEIIIQGINEAKSALTSLIVEERIKENERYLEMLKTGNWRSFATEVTERLAELKSLTTDSKASNNPTPDASNKLTRGSKK